MIITWMREAPILYHYLRDSLPRVEAEVDRWTERARSIPSEMLAQQAQASLKHKRFHCQGGSIYAEYAGERTPDLIRFIVALQTISDYLDNLCDRCDVQNETAFRRLHEAMLCAVDPDRPLVDYYAYFPHREDGGYLADLVQCARDVVVSLPAYDLVREPIVDLVAKYNELQVLKHLSLLERQLRLRAWAQPQAEQYHDVFWWEFAAATGSTLGVFCLAACAADPELKAAKVAKILAVYFPWVCGIHILLDYFIDQTEDATEGDLNFVTYYASERERRERMGLFAARALEKTDTLPDPAFHRLMIQGLLAMYLSDPKARRHAVRRTVDTLLNLGGLAAKGLHFICMRYRERGML